MTDGQTVGTDKAISRRACRREIKISRYAEKEFRQKHFLFVLTFPTVSVKCISIPSLMHHSECKKTW